MTHVQTLPDAEALAAHAASEIARLLEQAREQRGVAHVALSGGGTPKRTYELLAQTLDGWDGVEVWFADERCVGPEDEQSNYRLAADTLLRPAAIPEERIHRMLGELGPEHGASRYAEELRSLGGAPLDVAVLGIGPEGHIASLFPHHPALKATGPCVGVSDSPKPPPERITLTLPVLQAVRHCLVIASGEEKAGAISGMLGEPTEAIPASLLAHERLTVMVDEAASGAPGAPWLTHGT
ncbi:MAG: 6-phosphogluconolactonase [Solirubrobacteraceae bacterium]